MMRDLLFISCTSAAKESTPLFHSLGRLGIIDYVFVEHNRQGLPACYNGFLDQHAGADQVLVFVHDDVTIADVFVRDKLGLAAQQFTVTGLVGSSYFDPRLSTDYFAWPLWPREHLSGAVEHAVPGGAMWSLYGPTPRRCVVLDGLFLAVDMAMIGAVRFDERFHFHLYDLDFCLSAHAAGLTLGTTNVYVNHASAGRYDTDAYRAALKAFREKWQGVRGS